MSKAVFFVMSDIFIPLTHSLGKGIKSLFGLDPDYFSFVPRDNKLLRARNLSTYPSNVYSFGRSGDADKTYLSEDETLEFLDFMVRKHGGKTNDWVRRFNRVAWYLESYFNQNDVRLVVLWNGADYVGRLLSLLSMRRKIPVLYLENGYFKNTLQCDYSGVNALSSLNSKSLLDLRSIKSSNRLGDFRDQTQFEISDFSSDPLEVRYQDLVLSGLMRKIDPCYYKRFPEQRGSTWLHRWHLNRNRRKLKQDELNIPTNFAFIPLQVHDDTQVLLNCRHFTDVESFVDIAYSAIKSTFGVDFPIVVKEHPEDLFRYDYSGLRRKYPDLIWLQKHDIDQLLDKASLVLVINSSVGLQAIRRFKPTVVFGDSFYTKDEVAFCVRDLSDLPSVLKLAGAGITNSMRDDISFFIEYLERDFFIPGSWERFNSSTISALLNRVEHVMSS